MKMYQDSVSKQDIIFFLYKARVLGCKYNTQMGLGRAVGYQIKISHQATVINIYRANFSQYTSWFCY